MAEGLIVPASREAVDAIGKLRECDERELWAALHMDGRKALLMSFEQAERSWAILADGHPVAIFGVSPYPYVRRQGCPWMLANDYISKIWRFVLRKTREYVHVHMMEGFDSLFNFVDVRNEASIRWLRWAGFHVGEPVPFGMEGEPFRPFWLRR
jgi:hypothetical protein